MYYAAVNSHASETSVGFANTWGVLGFATKAMRDAYVHKATDLATKAIRSDEIRAYDGKPGQVSYYDSTGAFFQHMERGEFARDGRTIDPVTASTVTDGIWSHA